MASSKERIWIEEYLTCWNATEAARRAGYRWPNKVGPAKLDKFRNIISERLAKKAMGADEVLARLAGIARADIGDFVPPNREDSSLLYAKEQAISYLVKSVTDTKYGQKFELHDSLAALVHIGRHHKLFTDKVEIGALYNKLGDLVRDGRVEPEELIERYGINYAQQLFKRIGIVVVASGEDDLRS